MSEYTIPQDQALRLDARARDLESRLNNLIVGVSRGMLRRTELLNQLATGVPSETARDVTGLTSREDVETITLSWGAVSDPLLAVYEVQWAATNDFLNSESRYTTNLFFTINGLDRVSAYFARVRARIGQELGRWSPVVATATGKASWDNLAEGSVTNLVRTSYGQIDAGGPAWFTAARFSVATPLDVAIAARVPGPSFCLAAFSNYTKARYVVTPDMPLGFLSGDGEGGCIVGPFEIDTIGGFVEFSYTASVYSDTTYESGLRTHILCDGEIVRDGWNAGNPDPSYNDYSLDRGVGGMIASVAMLDPPTVGHHKYEIAFEPYMVSGAGFVIPSCVAFIKYVDVQMLELRR
jgi:hypothetical protein